MIGQDFKQMGSIDEISIVKAWAWGPEALYRPGQARPTHRAYEGLGPGLGFHEALASDSLV